MAQLPYRFETVQTVSGNALHPGSGYTVSVLKQGAVANGVSAASPITVYAGHGFAAGDKFFVGATTGQTRTVSSVTSTSIVYSGTAVSVSSGDFIVNIGSDTCTVGANAPNWDGGDVRIFTDPAGTAVITGSNVNTNSQGEYGYYHLGHPAWEVVRAGNTLSVTDINPGAINAGESIQLRQANQYATGGLGTSSSPWTGWEGVVDRGNLSEVAVHFPAGYYSTAQRVLFKDRTTITGDGAVSVIQLSASLTQVAGENNCILGTTNSGGAPLYSFSSPGDYVRISAIKVSFNNFIAYAGIRLWGIRDVQIRDVTVDGTDSDTGNDSSLGLFGISVGETTRCTITGCHVLNLLNGGNSNGISASGQTGSPYAAGNSLVIANNLIERLGTIGLNVGNGSFDTFTITGNTIRGAQYGIALEGTATLFVRNVTISGNTILGTTDLSNGYLAGRSLNHIAIEFWGQAAAGTDTGTLDYSLDVTGNTIKDYGTAFATTMGQVAFRNNHVHNWGQNTYANAVVSAIRIGNVFAGFDLNNVLIEGNYFYQGTLSVTGTNIVGVVKIDNSGGGTLPINGIFIRNNIINGTDTASTGTIYGIYALTPGSNWDISGNYIKGTRNIPIYVIPDAYTVTPKNIRIHGNTIVDCNAGSTANAAIYFQDANNYTWSGVSVTNNLLQDANDKTTYLFKQTGTGWAAGLTMAANVVQAGASYLGTASLISRNNIVTQAMATQDRDGFGVLSLTGSGATYTANLNRNTTFLSLTTSAASTAVTLEVPGANEDGRLLMVKNNGSFSNLVSIADSGSMRMIGNWEPYDFHDAILFMAKGGIWFEIARSDVSTNGTRLSHQAGITASTTQTQGQGVLTYELNEVSVVANASDTVTLPPAWQGRRVIVINNGANVLQIFPGSGDNLGAGANTATTIATTEYVEFYAYDATNWKGSKHTKI